MQAGRHGGRAARAQVLGTRHFPSMIICMRMSLQSQHQKQGDERERLLKALQVSRAAALSAQEQLQKGEH